MIVRVFKNILIGKNELKNFLNNNIFKNLDVNKIDKNSYDKSFLTTLHSKKKNPIVIYGVNRTGLMALCGFKNISVKVDYFTDDDLSKNDKSFYGIKKNLKIE